MKKYLIITIAILCGVIFIMGNTIKKAKDENTRLTKNEYVLNDTIRNYKIRDSINVSEIKELNYTLSEMKDFRKADLELIKDLKIRLKTAESTTHVKTEIEYITKDSLIYVSDSLRKIGIHNHWINLDLNIYPKDYDLKLNVIDSLSIVGYKERPKKFLFIRYGKWDYYVDIVNYNPYSKVLYMEKITIGKRKRK
jgi:hypothetical protein